MNIYQNIDVNKRNSLILVIAFTLGVVLLTVIYGTAMGVDVYGLIPVALIFSGVTSLVSYYHSDSIVLSISGAKEVSTQQAPQLHALVDNMAIASGLPKPRIYIIEDTAMNAFATGRDPKHGVICFTTGILSRLEKRELEGVIAHEMSHIGNYDILFMSLVSILVGTVTLLSDWFSRGIFYGSRRNSKDNGGSGLILILALVLILLSPVIATLIKLAISRNREFLADASAALMTRYPKGLADALRKLSQDREILEAANGATAHLYIASPLRSDVSGAWAGLFNTHPPIEDRIKRLEMM